MGSERRDVIRNSVLGQMDRANRQVRFVIFGASMVELGFIVLGLQVTDMHNHLERLLLIMALSSCTIIILGLAALGAHVTRCASRILTAMQTSERAL